MKKNSALPRTFIHAIWTLSWAWLGLVGGRLALADDIDFPHQVVPLLKTFCIKCHSGPQQEGGLSLDTRESLLVGGDSGQVVVVGTHADSEFFHRISSNEDGYRMPPEGASLTTEQATVIAQWIDSGMQWEPGYSFAPASYESPLNPRRPELPPAMAGRQNPIDRILDHELTAKQRTLPHPINDEVFLRRVTLDLNGLLPTAEQRQDFLNHSDADKRTQLIDTLLQDDIAYAEHWLTFWNDLLRNDYTGTGFITGGRTQITAWLYDALVSNKPFNQFARELIAPPTNDSAGFINGIRWRGEVSAGQTVEIQFAQSVAQTFLGINLKCASCHDSFIDRWTLEEAFGLAAIYSQQPLEIHRCDQALGKMAEPKWLFPELGTVDPAADKATRLAQLADLLTHPDNGRFTRTIVNRLWHRLMGRGIVHPTDAMQTEPWNEDLLDYLAVHLADHDYDLKQTLRLIVTSQAYQSQVESVAEIMEVAGYQYAGPRAKRLTAEQFMDAVWQLTQAAPTAMDAQVQRRRPTDDSVESIPRQAQWIWNQADATKTPAGQAIAFRKVWTLSEIPSTAVAVISCDNEYRLYLNGRFLVQGTQWETPNLIVLDGLVAGENELLIVGRNGGSGPNPAGLFCQVQYSLTEGTSSGFGSDDSWQWSATLPNETGRYLSQPTDWRAAVALSHANIWSPRVAPQVQTLLKQGISGGNGMVRASLVKSDFLMRSLGRPNRDQIVSVRPLELTTLEAIDLAIGETLDGYLQKGARRLQQRSWQSPSELVHWVFQHGLSREPTAEELKLLTADLSQPMETSQIADLLWAVIMLPEFQIIR